MIHNYRRTKAKAPVNVSSLLAKLAAGKRRWMNIELEYVPRSASHSERWMLPGNSQIFSNRQQAIRFYCAQHPRTYGPYSLEREWPGRYSTKLSECTWNLQLGGTILEHWHKRPSRWAIAQGIKKHRLQVAAIKRQSHFGWRTFDWSFFHMRLKSPTQKTIWDGPELIVPESQWSTEEAVRGRAGIHACRLPLDADWKEARQPHDMPRAPILALCERFGRYVLGEVGWRAEWVIIRELLVPSENIAQVIRYIYPEVVVHVASPDHWIHTSKKD